MVSSNSDICLKSCLHKTNKNKFNSTFKLKHLLVNQYKIIFWRQTLSKLYATLTLSRGSILCVQKAIFFTYLNIFYFFVKACWSILHF